MITLSENEVTKRLAAWGALITVPTLIAGIYGMNFEHMPELEWAFGYPVALAMMVVDRRAAVLAVPRAPSGSERLALSAQVSPARASRSE